MKTDKILFCAACVGMGILMHSNLNHSNDEPFMRKADSTLIDSAKLKPLTKDSVEFSNAVKADTLKLLKKVK